MRSVVYSPPPTRWRPSPGKKKRRRTPRNRSSRNLLFFGFDVSRDARKEKKTKHFANDSKNQFRVDERPRKKKKRKLTGKKNNFLKNFLHKREI